MRKILKQISLIISIFLVSFNLQAQGLADVVNSSSAQEENPVTWSSKVNKISDGVYEIVFKAQAKTDWHFYSQYSEGTMPMAFTFDQPVGYKTVGDVSESPKPKEEYDDVLGGLTKYWDDKATFKQKIEVLGKEDAKVKVYIDYQACIHGACMPLMEEFDFELQGKVEVNTDQQVQTTVDSPDPLNTSDSLVKKNDTISDKETVVSTKIETPKNEENNTADAKKEKEGWGSIFIFAFIAGLLTLITPCVFPMIPMTVSFFMKGNKSRSAGLKQAYFFGFSIILIFAVLGLLLTILLGDDAMYVISTHWIPNTIFFIIFMVFALSFFGLFELTLPSGLINKSDKNAEKGGYIGTFFVAFTTVLVSFSCTGPILGAALIELSSGSDNSLVFLISMIGFALGFAVPFTLLAMFPSALKKLKSGSWLNTVKIVFGFIEIALGLKFLSMADLSANWGILDREVFLSLWIVTFTLLGFYLLGKLKFKGDSDLKSIPVSRLFLAIITFSFVIYMIPGLWGAPLKALSGYVPPMTTQDFDINRTIIENAGSGSVSNHNTNELGERKYTDELHLPTGFEGFFDLEEAKAYSKKVNKPIFVDFTGKTCANCREMENNVWTHPEVKKILNNEFVMVALYADANFIKLPEEEWFTPEDGGRKIKSLGSKNLYYQKKRFNISAQPYYVLMDANENVLTEENRAYDKDVNAFITFLNEGIKNYKAQ
jgi:thiol:disulfide interchange protein